MQPILTTARKGNARCIACHSRGGGNSYLEPLSPGATDLHRGTERAAISSACVRLVVPGEPLKSVLLINPLAEEAGGSHWHGGGKHWQSQNDPEWQTLAAWVRQRQPRRRLPPRHPRGIRGCRIARGPAARDDAEPRGVQDARAADPDQPAQGQRALHRVSLARRRQQLSRSRCRPAPRPTPTSRRAAISSASSGSSSRRAAEEPAAHQPAGGRSRRQPLARRRQALAVAERSRVSDAGGMGARSIE